MTMGVSEGIGSVVSSISGFGEELVYTLEKDGVMVCDDRRETNCCFCTWWWFKNTLYCLQQRKVKQMV